MKVVLQFSIKVKLTIACSDTAVEDHGNCDRNHERRAASHISYKRQSLENPKKPDAFIVINSNGIYFKADVSSSSSCTKMVEAYLVTLCPLCGLTDVFKCRTTANHPESGLAILNDVLLSVIL